MITAIAEEETDGEVSISKSLNYVTKIQNCWCTLTYTGCKLLSGIVGLCILSRRKLCWLKIPHGLWSQKYSYPRKYDIYDQPFNCTEELDSRTQCTT